MSKDPCLSCGATDYLQSEISFKQTEDGKRVMGIWKCNKCQTMGKPYYTDASGNRLVVTEDRLGKYSYALDAPIISKRQLSEVCKRMSLSQRG